MFMDTTEHVLDRVIALISGSSLSDTEKADMYAQLAVGLRSLVWPVVLSHIPEYLLQQTTARGKTSMTVDEYRELIDAALSNPATPVEIHQEVSSALREVEELLVKRLPKAPDPKS